MKTCKLGKEKGTRRTFGLGSGYENPCEQNSSAIVERTMDVFRFSSPRRRDRLLIQLINPHYKPNRASLTVLEKVLKSDER